MGLRTFGRFLAGMIVGAVVGLLVARRTVADGAEVFALQRGPTMMAVVLGAFGGGIASALSSHGHTKSALTVLLVTGLLLAFVTIAIQTNAANVL
jgi:hypothetical protein